MILTRTELVTERCDIIFFAVLAFFLSICLFLSERDRCIIEPRVAIGGGYGEKKIKCKQAVPALYDYKNRLQVVIIFHLDTALDSLSAYLHSREYEIFVEKRGIVIIVFTASGAVEYAILAEVINAICFLAAF
jgi:hypothetical protein